MRHFALRASDGRRTAARARRRGAAIACCLPGWAASLWAVAVAPGVACTRPDRAVLGIAAVVAGLGVARVRRRASSLGVVPRRTCSRRRSSVQRRRSWPRVLVRAGRARVHPDAPRGVRCSTCSARRLPALVAGDADPRPARRTTTRRRFYLVARRRWRWRCSRSASRSSRRSTARSDGHELERSDSAHARRASAERRAQHCAGGRRRRRSTSSSARRDRVRAASPCSRSRTWRICSTQARAARRAVRVALLGRARRPDALARHPRRARRAARRGGRAVRARHGRRRSGWSEQEQELAHTAGLLHDIGHFALSDRVAERGRTLTEEDWVAIQRHPELGADMLKDLGMYGPVAEIVLAHHERIDGRGYPSGLTERGDPGDREDHLGRGGVRHAHRERHLPHADELVRGAAGAAPRRRHPARRALRRGARGAADAARGSSTATPTPPTSTPSSTWSGGSRRQAPAGRLRFGPAAGEVQDRSTPALPRRRAKS